MEGRGSSSQAFAHELAVDAGQIRPRNLILVPESFESSASARVSMTAARCRRRCHCCLLQPRGHAAQVRRKPSA